MAKWILEEAIQVTNQLTESIKWELPGRLLNWAQSNYMSHLDAVFSDWQCKGKSKDSKHQKDLLCLCWFSRWRWPCTKVCSWEWHLSGQPAGNGPQSYNYQELNSVNNLKASGSMLHSKIKLIQWGFHGIKYVGLRLESLLLSENYLLWVWKALCLSDLNEHI